jgi:integrase
MANQEVKNEWDGKDFRDDKVTQSAIEFLKQNPEVFEWVRKKPRDVINHVGYYFKPMFNELGITPKDWLALEPQEARDKSWSFIDKFTIKHPAKAHYIRSLVKSFYEYHNETTLNFKRDKFKIDIVEKKTKYPMNKDVVWKIIHRAKTLRDETLLTMDFECGMRRNGIANLTYGHYKHFYWFKINDGVVEPATELDGEVAIFKVNPTPSLEYTYDKKLRKKAIFYFAGIHKEATVLLKRFIMKYHKNSMNETPLWQSREGNRLSDGEIYYILKECVARTDLPLSQITFHALRRAFRHTVRNTATITDNEFKEAIMGHKLKGAQEAYFDKDPVEFAREYAKIDFSLSTPLKDLELEKKEKENVRLKEQLAQMQDAIKKAKATTKIEIEPLHPLGPEASRAEIDTLFKEFNGNQEPAPQPIPRPAQTEAVMPTQATEKPIVKETHEQTRAQMPDETEWIWCPSQMWVKKETCEQQCRTKTSKQYSMCQSERQRHPNGPLFQLPKPKLEEVIQ